MNIIWILQFCGPTIMDEIFETKEKEIKKNWTEALKFDSCFCVDFDCYYKSIISGKTGH